MGKGLGKTHLGHAEGAPWRRDLVGLLEGLAARAKAPDRAAVRRELASEAQRWFERSLEAAEPVAASPPRRKPR